jgi:hypothetical protein
MIQVYNTCEVETIRTQFAQSDGTLASLFRSVLAADFARTRAGGMQ